jgi:hypothetical protein
MVRFIGRPSLMTSYCLNAAQVDHAQKKRAEEKPHISLCG